MPACRAASNSSALSAKSFFSIESLLNLGSVTTPRLSSAIISYISEMSFLSASISSCRGLIATATADCTILRISSRSLLVKLIKPF